MAKCKIHTDTDLIEYCPICRGQHGGTVTAAGMTKKQKSQRARKAAKARWSKKPKKT